jgi:hypothetical protein
MNQAQEWVITKEDYNILINYFGCGNFTEAKVLFFGNEEGIGGNELEANIVSRIEKFGQYDENGLLLSSLKLNNKECGYWEPNGALGGDKVHAYLFAQGRVSEEKRKPFKEGFFLPMAARICLDLENPQLDPTYWFQTAANREAKNEIDHFILDHLFRERESGIQTALTDWRPLPRVTEKDSPKEYARIDWKKYSRAFGNPYSKRVIKDEFTCYSEDAKRRAAVLQELLIKFKIPVMIGFGNIPVKMKLLNSIFPGTRFETMTSVAFPNHKGMNATIPIQDHQMYVILLPFPDPSTQTWYGIPKEDKYSTMLSYFREMVQAYIKPKFK